MFELEGQVEEMNALYNLKLRQENSRPSTPAFAPKDSESMLHQQAHASSRELQASRQSEISSLRCYKVPVRAPVRVPSS